MSIKEKDFPTALGFLQVGLEYTHMQGVTYTHLLFMLSKVMVRLNFFKITYSISLFLKYPNIF